MITVSGTGGAGMLALAGRLRSAVADAPTGEAIAAQPEAEKLIDQGFIFARAPDGAKWKPRKPPTGSWPLLVKNNLMFSGRRVLKGRGNLVMTLPTPAEFHQKGTRYMVARKMLPIDELPDFWQEQIGAARARWWRERVLGAA